MKESFEINDMEKGEYSQLLDDACVKPTQTSMRTSRSYTKKKKTFPWKRCICWTLASIVGLIFLLTCGTLLWVRSQVIRFTVDRSLFPNPPLDVLDVDMAQLRLDLDEAKLFWDMLLAGEEPKEDLIVTEDHINGWIASSDYLRGHAQARLTTNSVHLDYALPTDGIPGGKHRYFAGAGELHDKSGGRFDVSLTPSYPVKHLDYPTLLVGTFFAYWNNQDPVVEMESGHLLNWIAPQDWIDEKQNLLDCAADDDHEHHHHHHHHDSSDDSSDDLYFTKEQAFEAISRIESVRILNGQLVIRPKRNVVDEEPSTRRLSESKPFKRGKALNRILRKITA